MKSPSHVAILRVFLSLLVLLDLRAATIGFDDLDASAADIPLETVNPYHDFTWSGFSAYTSIPGFDGFNNGIVSGSNAAYTAGDALGVPLVSTITRAGGFDFISGNLGSGWYDGLSVTLNGLFGGVQQFSSTVTVNTSDAQFFAFNFAGIDELDIFATVPVSPSDPFGCGPTGCTQVTLDDLTLIPLDLPPSGEVPEPGSFGVIAIALSALCASRFRAGFRKS